MKINVIVVGKQKKSPSLEMCNEYIKRMKWKLSLKEIEAPKGCDKAKEAEMILREIPENSFIVALDERGQSYTSQEFSEKLELWSQQALNNELFFLIGGADGFDKTIRDKAKILLSFGKQTWPHMLVRVMLLEQLYRAQQISEGHPYHRQ